jgi:hypothetical protein
MPLTECPDCEATISDLALSCVRCGRPVNRQAPSVGLPAPTKVGGQAFAEDPAMAVGVIRTLSQAASPDTSWRAIVTECRQYVPLIESAAGQGSGLLVSAEGFIVTNEHVLTGQRLIMVTLFDGTRAKGVVVHRHPTMDLAIVKAALHTIRFFVLSERVARAYEAGDEVLAIGHPRGLTFTSTRGIVSDPHRVLPWGQFVQTDVAINPGNSGGPLLNRDGELVGLNTSVQQDAQGIGFAIPGELVSTYADEVVGMLREGRLSVPSDEELASLENDLSPHEILDAAIRSTGLACTPDQVGQVRAWELTTGSGASFHATVVEGILLLTRFFATLEPRHLSDPLLLQQLLRLQNELSMVWFVIDEEDCLSLRFRRPTEDLDMSEAQTALLVMAHAVDMLEPLLADLIL